MGEIIMSVYSQVSSYSDYVDLQHYTGSLATRPQMSGAIWLSGSGVNDTQFHFNSKLETPGLTLDDTTSVTSILDQDNMSSNSATALATQQSIKAYVDSQVTSADLDFAADSGSGDVDLTTETFQISGTNNEIETAASNQTLTIGLPSTVAITAALSAGTSLAAGTTVSGSGAGTFGTLAARTLDIDSMAGNWTNASRTVADMGTVTTMDLNGGTIDGTTIGASSQTSGKFTTVSGSGNASFRGTLTAVEAASSFAGVTCTTVSGSGTATAGDLAARTLDIDSMAGNWTNAGRTVADLGTITTVDINGGTADAVVIGGASAAAGTFTTLIGATVSGSSSGTFGSLAARTLDIDSMAGNWTNASRTVADMGTVTTMDLNGGSIDGTTIGAAAAGAGTFTTLIGATVSGSGAVSGGSLTARTLDIDSFAANWTNASRTVADMGTVTTIDLNGGTIDGTTIGASSQTSGKFTTVSGSGQFRAQSFSAELGVTAVTSIAAGTTVSGSGAGTFGTLAARTLDIDSMAGNWTNASRTVADLGTITTVDINGGTADALVIGGASAAAGTFTDVSASADGDFGDLLARTLEIDSFAANWTNASRTVADMGIVTTMDLNGGSIDGVTIGTAAAATRLVVQGAGAQSVKSTGANHITLSAGQGESANVAANLIFNASNNITFDAQGTDEDDGFIFSLGADTDGVIFSIENNSGDSLLMLDGGGLMEHNSENKAAADFVFNASTSTDKVVFDSGENCLIVYDGGSETMRLGGDATSDYALDVKDGSNNINKVRAAAFVTYSDERLKTDVVEMNNALKTINSIKAVNFTWKKDGTQDFGFLAQDLKKVIPQAVHGNEDGLLGVDYGRLTSVLVKAIQEQSAQIDALKKKIDN